MPTPAPKTESQQKVQQKLTEMGVMPPAAGATPPPQKPAPTSRFWPRVGLWTGVVIAAVLLVRMFSGPSQTEPPVVTSPPAPAHFPSTPSMQISGSAENASLATAQSNAPAKAPQQTNFGTTASEGESPAVPPAEIPAADVTSGAEIVQQEPPPAIPPTGEPVSAAAGQFAPEPVKWPEHHTPALDAAVPPPEMPISPSAPPDSTGDTDAPIGFGAPEGAAAAATVASPEPSGGEAHPQAAQPPSDTRTPAPRSWGYRPYGYSYGPPVAPMPPAYPGPWTWRAPSAPSKRGSAD